MTAGDIIQPDVFSLGEIIRKSTKRDRSLKRKEIEKKQTSPVVSMGICGSIASGVFLHLRFFQSPLTTYRGIPLQGATPHTLLGAYTYSLHWLYK